MPFRDAEEVARYEASCNSHSPEAHLPVGPDSPFEPDFAGELLPELKQPRAYASPLEPGPYRDVLDVTFPRFWFVFEKPEPKEQFEHPQPYLDAALYM